jgi:pimeloyl-ACP methyl ester carboxylesterase
MPADTTATATTRARTISGAMLSYEESGPREGRAVVLVHGFPLDSRIFAKQAAALCDACRVIGPDLRGFGKSRSDDSFTVASLADDLHALLSDIGGLPCTLGGLSMGGYVALAFAKKYPRDLRALLLIDTRSEGDTPDGKAGRDKMIDQLRSGGPKAVADAMLPKMLSEEGQKNATLVRELREIMESQPPRTIEHALVALRDRADYTADLPSITAPTLIIVGEKDAITPPAMSEKLNKAIPKSNMVVIPGAGHVSSMEKPAEVTAAIRGFVGV